MSVEGRWVACGHYQVGNLIDHHHYIRQIAVSVLGIETALREFAVVFFHGAHSRRTQQFVAGVHLDTQRRQGGKGLGRIGDDGIVLVGYFGEEMLLKLAVKAEFHHLGVDKHQLELAGMLLEEQRG